MAFEAQTGLFEHDDYTSTFYTPVFLPFTPFPDHTLAHGHGHGHTIMSDRLDTHGNSVSTLTQPRLLHSSASQSHSSASSSSSAGVAGDSSPIEPSAVHTHPHAQRTLTVSPISSTSSSSASDNDDEDDAAGSAGQGNKATRKAPNNRLKGVTKPNTTRPTKPRVLKEDKREAKIIKERDRRAKLQERFTELADALDLDEDVRCDRLKLLSESITLIRLMKEELQSLRRESDGLPTPLQSTSQAHVQVQPQTQPQTQTQTQAQGQGFMQAFNMPMGSAAYAYDPTIRHGLSLDAHTEIAPMFFPEMADFFPSSASSSSLTFQAIHPAHIVQQQQQQHGNATHRNMTFHTNPGMINRNYIQPVQVQPAQPTALPTPVAPVPIQRVPGRRHKFSIKSGNEQKNNNA